jgi:hypothetical protein
MTGVAGQLFAGFYKARTLLQTFGVRRKTKFRRIHAGNRNKNVTKLANAIPGRKSARFFICFRYRYSFQVALPANIELHLDR